MGVREGLLALLADGPTHGYSLKTAFESATGGIWPLNVGQVYSTLDRLERDGLVSSDGADRPTYRLTEKGVEELGAWWRVAPGDQPPPRDELMVKVLLAITLGSGHALDVITEQRSALMLMLQHHQRTRARDESLAGALVHDALVVRAEADLRWLDMCEERLLSEPTEGNGNRRARRRAREKGDQE